ncbi:alpha/beta hydrolase [Stenotrophomonas maltophilia]|nr:alpha/beta hydrolase [Stenotrophomonas maltophilia]
MRASAIAIAVLLVLSPCVATAVAPTWQPPPGSTEMPLWPAGKVMVPPKLTGPEEVRDTVSKASGERWAMLQNVAVPTLTVFPAKGGGNGAAVIWDPDCNCRDNPTVPMALQDAQRAMGLLRAQAQRWNIDPKRVGVIGFSAGGHVVAGLSTHGARSYAAVDAADAQPSRPDFAMVMYSGHLWTGAENGLSLADDIAVDDAVPPTFIVQSTDDPTDDVRESLTYYRALIDVGVPVEMHLFARGGHAFGLRAKDAPVTAWPQLAERWMQDIGMLPERQL